MFGLFDDHVDGFFATLWWVAELFEEAFDHSPHGGAGGVFELPVDGEIVSEFSVS